MVQKCVAGWIAVLGLLASASLFAQADMDAAAEALQMFETAEIVALSDEDVGSWISTVEELIAADIDTLNDEASLGQAMRTLADSNEAMGILKRNGYDLETFESHATNITMAIGAAEMAGQREEIESSLAQMEAMKSQIPAAQYEMMIGQVKSMMAIFDRTPPENIAVVSKYRDRIDALGDD